MCVRGVAACVLKSLTFLSRIGGLQLTWTFEVLERGINPTISNVFQIVLKSKGEIPPVGGMENLAGAIFSSSGGNLTRSDFDYWNLFQS